MPRIGDLQEPTPIDTPTDARNSASARLVGELRSATMNTSAIPIASSEVMMCGVVSIAILVRLFTGFDPAEAFFHLAVELLGDRGIVIQHLLRVGLRVLDAAQVGVGLLHTVAPQADVAHGRHDAGKEALLEAGMPFRLVEHRTDILPVHAEALPHLRRIEAVAQVARALDDEILALAALGLGELRVVVAQREAPEGDMARCPASRRRSPPGTADSSSSRGCAGGDQREALDQHLHAG
jgi:hypothetical protein